MQDLTAVPQERPEIQEQIVFNLNDLHLLFCKIAYELSTYHYGNDFLTHKYTNDLRMALLKGLDEDLSAIDNVLMGTVPTEAFQGFLEEEFGYVILVDGVCILKLAPLDTCYAIRTNDSSGDIYAASVYRFCYQTQTWANLSFIDFILRK